MRPRRWLTVVWIALTATGCDNAGDKDHPAGALAHHAGMKRHGPKWSLIADLPTPVHAPLLVPGNMVTDTLSTALPPLPDSTRYAVWGFRGEAGDLMTVEMHSTSIDPYLLLVHTGQKEPRVLNETRAEGTSARIRHELPVGGEFWIIANTTRPGTGDYTLTLDREPLPAATGGSPTDKVALLVGVGDYPGVQKDLPDVGPDLDMMRRVLIERFGFLPENVLVLRDHEATRRRVVLAFGTHLDRVAPGGTALFYFSGHGLQLPSNDLLVGDEDPEENERDEGLYLGDGSTLYDDEVGMMADALDCDRTVIVLDCCHAGDASRGEGWSKSVTLEGAGPFVSRPTSSPGVDARDPGNHLLLAACAPHESARVAPGLPGLDPPGIAGAFTYHLVQQLESVADSTTFHELMAQVRVATMLFVEEELGVVQTPQVKGSLQGARVSRVLTASP